MDSYETLDVLHLFAWFYTDINTILVSAVIIMLWTITS